MKLKNSNEPNYRELNSIFKNILPIRVNLFLPRKMAS
jgi:hypothetical protein